MRRYVLSASAVILLSLPPTLMLQSQVPGEDAEGETLNPSVAGPVWTLVGWNDLGMHCMDADYSVFSILPPYNTIHAQLIKDGKLVTSTTGISVKYQALMDPDGSMNRTSAGKTNFWTYVFPLFGARLPVNVGLTKKMMPGLANTPQAMVFDAGFKWFSAEGIPITPRNDRGKKNAYPMMRLVARNAAGSVLAKTDIVLPVSDEMDCRACHASGSGSAAQPRAGWVRDPNPDRDYKRNILLLHDERQASNPAYAAALAKRGYNKLGLFAQVKKAPVLCASCHASNALPGTGIAGLSPLTRAVHAHHASVQDPSNGETLDSATNRSACYRCHPGAETRCLRGAMGSAIAGDGSQAMQCQNCHGSMSAVGSDRSGWLDQPGCQHCHTGTATSNNGQIRYTSVFEAPGQRRVVASQVFATSANTPAAGLSLYRFSKGHGGLQCEACHGSTHAEYPSSHSNDNIQSTQLQGHVGTIAECGACHSSIPRTVTGGPHGLHPIGPQWVEGHHDAAEDGGARQCQACHGADYRGTVLSRSQADRTVTSEFGSRFFWRGFQIGCYACHNGPDGERPTTNHAPIVDSTSATTAVGKSVSITVNAIDLDGQTLTLRIVSQPKYGRAAIVGTQATYYPDAGFIGADSFTFAAWDGFTDSNLGTVAVTVSGTLSAQAGMHPAGVRWVQTHHRAVERGGEAGCQSCHGQDYRGTENSRTRDERFVLIRSGKREFWSGFQVGCFACHNGPKDRQGTVNRTPAVLHESITVSPDMLVRMALRAVDPDGQPMTFRIVDGPAHGSVQVQGANVAYSPAAGFVGTDSFTYAAWDGFTNSNLGRVRITVRAKPSGVNANKGLAD